MEQVVTEKSEKISAKQATSHQYFLRSIPLFKGLSPAALQELLAHSRAMRYGRHEPVFRIGEPARYFYIVVSGWVKLYRETRDGHEAVLGVSGTRDVFGKTAVLSHGAHSYNAEAVSETTMLLVSKIFIQHMLQHHTEYDHFLSHLLEAGLRDWSQRELHIEHLAQLTASQRVACFLLRSCGGMAQGETHLMLPYEKALLAGHLGMSAETFSRAIGRLASLGVEAKQGHEVIIHDIDALRHYVCGHCSATINECVFGDKE
jgi:CRP-like cAMP-binding protein